MAARGAALIPTSIKGPDEIAHVQAVVLTWNGAHLLPDCLRALQAQTVQVRITVVDNGSSDETSDLLARDFPQVRHLVLPQNLGYGRANNQAMRGALEAGASFIALVNNDVQLAPDWFEKLLAAARKRPDDGLFCGTLLFRGVERRPGIGPQSPAGVGRDETVNSTGLVMDFFGRARDRDFRLPLEKLQRPDGPVLGVSGGAALLRGAMLRAVGLFDPDYFAYYEDVDLSLRAAALGFRSYYVRDAFAWHRFGASFGPGSPRQRYLLGRGHLRTLALHQPLGKALLLVPLTIGYRTAVKAPMELLRARPSHALAELRAAASGGLSAARALAARVSGR
jgi:N-acetylglucosaminyl-diphospho-decaprenol L-rhamnosyltransferase